MKYTKATTLVLMSMVAFVLVMTSGNASSVPFDPSPPPGTECLFCEVQPVGVRDIVRTTAREAGIPEEMLVAMAEVESNFDPLAISSAGAVGVLQVVPQQAGREVYRLRGLPGEPEHARLTDPQYNAEIAAEYIRYLTGYFGEASANPEIVVAAFNAGPTRVQGCIRQHGQNWRQCLPLETRSYLRKVDLAMTDGLFSVAL